MKRLSGAILGLLVLAAPVMAEVLTIPEGTKSVEPIAGELLGVKAINATATTELSFKFTLGGCVDSLLPLVTRIERQGSQAKVYITALNVHNEASERVRCVAIPTATAKVVLPGRYQQRNVQVIFLGTKP
jgi:hypothetical protein